MGQLVQRIWTLWSTKGTVKRRCYFTQGLSGPEVEKAEMQGEKPFPMTNRSIWYYHYHYSNSIFAIFVFEETRKKSQSRFLHRGHQDRLHLLFHTLPVSKAMYTLSKIGAISQQERRKQHDNFQTFMTCTDIPNNSYTFLVLKKRPRFRFIF